jgi:type I site-specific restriction endonuclease
MIGYNSSVLIKLENKQRTAMTLNQNPEPIALDQIDKLLLQSGWVIQNKIKINFHLGESQFVREYQTDSGPADYILFVGDKPGDVIEASAEQHGRKFISVEEQTAEYAAANLKRTERQAIRQSAFSGQLHGDTNSDALPAFDTVAPDWLKAAELIAKYQKNQ